jgi:hypothetical protein
MNIFATEVLENGWVIAARILKGVREDACGGEGTLRVHLGRDSDRGWGSPSGIEGDRAERISEDAP